MGNAWRPPPALEAGWPQVRCKEDRTGTWPLPTIGRTRVMRFHMSLRGAKRGSNPRLTNGSGSSGGRLLPRFAPRNDMCSLTATLHFTDSRTRTASTSCAARSALAAGGDAPEEVLRAALADMLGRANATGSPLIQGGRGPRAAHGEARLDRAYQETAMIDGMQIGFNLPMSGGMADPAAMARVAREGIQTHAQQEPGIWRPEGWIGGRETIAP